MKSEEQKAWRPSSSEESGIVGEIDATHNHDVFGSEEHHDVCTKDDARLLLKSQSMSLSKQNRDGTLPRILLLMANPPRSNTKHYHGNSSPS